MAVVSGSFKRGCPFVEVTIAGPDAAKAKTFFAMVDTGFGGFIWMPLAEARPLGIEPSEAAMRFELADGGVLDRSLNLGHATIGGSTHMGVIALDESSVDVLLGMTFLRRFQLVLYLTGAGFYLIPQNELRPPPQLPAP